MTKLQLPNPTSQSVNIDSDELLVAIVVTDPNDQKIIVLITKNGQLYSVPYTMDNLNYLKNLGIQVHEIPPLPDEPAKKKSPHSPRFK